MMTLTNSLRASGILVLTFAVLWHLINYFIVIITINSYGTIFVVCGCELQLIRSKETLLLRSCLLRLTSHTRSCLQLSRKLARTSNMSE